ncbi:hypothetical protein IQ252_08290 [Tychonema sp. LEGE 07203]|nr:hypothetical protein [Tychonema sp. LEGE 07203]
MKAQNLDADRLSACVTTTITGEPNPHFFFRGKVRRYGISPSSENSLCDAPYFHFKNTMN